MNRSVCYLIIVIALLVTLPLFTFQALADSTLPSDKLLDGLKERIQQNDPAVETTFTQLNQFFTTHPDDYNQPRFLNLKSYYHILKQDYMAGYEALLKARELAHAANNTLALAESYRMEGVIMDLSGEHANALEALNRSLSIYNEVDSERILLVYSAMGNVYTSLKNYEQMLAYAQQYLATAQRIGSERDEGVAYFFQGTAQRELGAYQDAKISLLLADDLLSQNQYPFMGIVYSAMAELYVAEGKLSDALKSLNQAAEADRKVGFRHNEGSQILQLAEIYKLQGKKELAIAELKAGIDTDAIQNDKVLLLDVLEQLISLSEATNNYRAALNYSKQYQHAYEQSFNEQQSRLLALNRVRLAISEKEETIKLLEKDNQLKEQRNLIQQKQNTFQLYFIIGVILSLVLVIGLLMRTRQQRKALDNLTQDLQKATKAKSDFLARMSHEIRTPLNAIIGLTKLSQRAAENQEQQTNLVQIEGASQTLLAIINDILDFSKIEAGKLDIESTPFHLGELVNQTMRLHLPRANEKHIELIHHIGRDVPVNLVGDPLRIQQILSNLVSNALKFTEDGLISVSVRCFEEASYVELEFEVKDTGIGLSGKQKSKLFKPFSQGDESTSRRYGGTGLGLTICKQLASLMGGNIWVESQLGKGASFYFTVRLKHAPAPQVVSPSIQLAGLKVLIADDLSASKRVISEALAIANIDADEASGGQEAIAKLREAVTNKKPYDVLILDFKMPDINGLDVAAIMNQEFVTKKPKVIMVSAFETPQMREQAKQHGVHTFIKKPFVANELVEKLQKLCLNLPTAQASAIQTQTPDLSGKKILFAEDNKLNQKVLLGLLSDTHASIQLVHNGLEALNALRKDKTFDVVLMDIQMPVMDGLTAAKAIRQELHLTLPIIAMTAHAMQQDIDESYAAGMDGHVNKPIEPSSFFSVLIEVLNDKKSNVSPQDTQLTSSACFDRFKPLSLCNIDKARAMQTLRDDGPLYQALLNDFLALQGELIPLRKAIDDKDFPTILKMAHIYTTALKYIGAYALAEFSSAIELVIQRNEQESTPDLTKQLSVWHQALCKVTAKAEQFAGEINTSPHR